MAFASFHLYRYLPETDTGIFKFISEVTSFTKFCRLAVLLLLDVEQIDVTSLLNLLLLTSRPSHHLLLPLLPHSGLGGAAV